MYNPIYQTTGHIDLFIPTDIFNEYKHIVMSILDGHPIYKHFTYKTSHSFRTTGEFELIPKGSLLDSTVIRNLLYRITEALYYAQIPHRLTATTTSPFREDIKEILLQYFVWINKDIELQSFCYERTVVPLYRSADYGTKNYIDRFRENLESLDKVYKPFIKDCGLKTGSESNQLRRLQILNAQKLLNN